MGGALGGVMVFLYCIREREDVLDLFESLTGARLLYGFHQAGGTRYDIPAGWGAQGASDTVDKIDRPGSTSSRACSINAFFMARTQGVGVASRELAQEVGISGPLLRGSGGNYDIRRAEPYSSYGDFDFKVPVETAGDCFARYRVRMVEFRESIKVVRQALDGLPEGPISSRPGVKSVGQVRIPKGEAYARVEGARGEVGCYLIADGWRSLYRMKWRGASFRTWASAAHHPGPQGRRRGRHHGLRRPRLRRGRPMRGVESTPSPCPLPHEGEREALEPSPLVGEEGGASEPLSPLGERAG